MNDVNRAYRLKYNRPGDFPGGTLADELRRTLGRALKAEFYLEHHEEREYCRAEGPVHDCNAEEHDYKDEGWQQAAHRELMGESKA